MPDRCSAGSLTGTPPPVLCVAEPLLNNAEFLITGDGRISDSRPGSAGGILCGVECCMGAYSAGSSCPELSDGAMFWAGNCACRAAACTTLRLAADLTGWGRGEFL